MFKIYFKQAVQMLKQNKFISIISILGIASAIMMIMTLIVTDEIKIINAVPENNRDRTLYITYQVKRDTTAGTWHSGSVTPDIFKDYISKMKTPEYISAMNMYFSDSKTPVNVEGVADYIPFCIRSIDASFWKIFSFSFIEGSGFSEEDFKAGINNVVLSETTVKKLFKGEKALGKTIQIGFQNYKVTGIVKDVSPVFKYAGGDIWKPYTAHGNNIFGIVVLLTAKDKKDFPKIIAEVRDLEKKFGIDHSPWMLYLKGPESQKVNTLDTYGSNIEEVEESLKIENRKMILIFLILLVIPALNLSGFSLSIIKKRTAEIGIRKAFGAKRYVILIQVLYENMITSLIGGFLGLIFSYVAVIWLRDWLLKVPEGSSIPVNTMISTSVFIAVFTACLLLNLLSAGLSAYRASRMSIVNSLNQNER